MLGALALSACGGTKIDDAHLQTDIQAGRGGAEVAFHATVIAAPVASGDHEVIYVGDRFGDRLELDYNTSLGPWVPLSAGQAVIIRGQLYIDSPTRVGVHCIHAHTSSGCPFPGYIEAGGKTYQ